MGNQMTSTSFSVPVLQSQMPAQGTDASPTPVFWIYMDDKCRWNLHKEGGEVEASFGSRADAARFVRDLAANSPYRLFIETPDGKIVQELHGTTPLPRAENENGGDSAIAAPAAMPKNAAASAPNFENADLGSRLEWARRLESAARVSPSRISLLAGWLRRIRGSQTG
jgi:hypothetical protein